jgi:hypothetical protein
MHLQRDLFNPMCGDLHAHQADLFDNDGPADSALRCTVCGEHLTRTPSGWLACQRGHGKLLAEGTGDDPAAFALVPGEEE